MKKIISSVLIATTILGGSTASFATPELEQIEMDITNGYVGPEDNPNYELDADDGDYFAIINGLEYTGKKIISDALYVIDSSDISIQLNVNGSIYIGDEALEIIKRDKNIEMDKWAKPFIDSVIKNGLLDDIALSMESSFKNKITREDFTEFIMKYVNFHMSQKQKDAIKAKNPSKTFNDTDSDFVIEAANMGIINGTDNKNKFFRPAENITREEVAVIVANVENLIYGTKPIVNIEEQLNKYSDQNKMSSWAKTSIAELTRVGLMSGYKGKFNPKNHITIQEVIVIVDNSLSSKKI